MNDVERLMTARSTESITSDVPEIIPGEVTTMMANRFNKV